MPGPPFGRVEPSRDGSPAKFRRPLATVPDETDRDDVHSTRDSALCSASLGLRGFASLFTFAGALVGPQPGDTAIIASLIGTFGSMIALSFLKEKSPVNLILLYALATFQGLSLGAIVAPFFAVGLGQIVLDASATTAIVTLVAGAYGMNTKRDLTSLQGILTIGLLAVVIAPVFGLFLRFPVFQLGIAVVSALLFTGFLVVDLARIARARNLSDGDTIMLTVAVYLDIVNLFLAILRILQYFAVRNRRPV